MNRDPQIVRRIILTADLETISPLLIGAGEDNNLTDTLVLQDKNGMPFIPGTSLAGVLRAMDSDLARYFGNINAGKTSIKDESQSTYIVSDIVLDSDNVVVRDSVRINPITGTAEKSGKFDYEAVERGAHGKLKISAIVRGWQSDESDAIKDGLERIGRRLQEEIFIGAHTRKGFGKVVCRNVYLDDYDFTKKEDVIAWLKLAPSPRREKVSGTAFYNPDTLIIEAELGLRSTLLVRTNDFDKDDYSDIIGNTPKIDNVQMKSLDDFVIPGASVRGVVFNQARKIMKVLGKDIKQLDNLFGYAEKSKSRRGRLIAEEIYFKDGVKQFKQCRNKIDRFTNATVDGALMTNIPLVQQKHDKPVLKMRLVVEKCNEWEAGLLLFILKDIWTGQVAFGGEKSIGRGVMDGYAAVITYKGVKAGIKQSAGKIVFLNEQDSSVLENWAKSLQEL